MGVVAGKYMQKDVSDNFQSSKTFTFTETQGHFVFEPNYEKNQYGRQRLVNLEFGLEYHQ